MKIQRNGLKSLLRLMWVAGGLLVLPAAGLADEAVTVVESVVAEVETLPYDSYEAFQQSDGFTAFTVNNLWILVAAVLVLVMHLGFATVESGLTRSKNTTNILFKNVFTCSMGILVYGLVGFNTMYPGEGITSWFSFGGPISIPEAGDASVSAFTDVYGSYTFWTDFIFQAMFAATAATILSGAVAERIKLGAYMVIATLLVAFFYPLSGYWQWGGGWLAERGFHDFAGSTLVHGFGGFVALGAVIVLGARAGKYPKEGGIRPIPGHSMPLVTIGAFLLFVGWFGFNGGSVLSADPLGVSYVFVTTAFGGAAGALVSILTSAIVLKKLDLSMALNGLLAGLVGITAGADVVGIWAAVVMGGVAGALVVFSVVFFDRIKVDDPVGAISVHGVCGVWGTLAVGIFGSSLDAETGEELISFGSQLLGAASVCVYAFVVGLALSLLVKYTIGIRVSAEEEQEGLDIQEHGMEAYPEFSSR
jgi:Amt family ammonium transporter